MPTKTGLMLAVAACAAVSGAELLHVRNTLPAAQASEAQSTSRIVLAEMATPGTRKPGTRRQAPSNFAIQGAAPGWPNGVPVNGGVAGQDAAGPVPDASGNVSGPSFSTPSANW